jgi:hypothetical protein
MKINLQQSNGKALWISMLLLAVITCSCESDDEAPVEKNGTADIQAFIVTKVAECGGPKVPVQTAPRRPSLQYRYSEDRDGAQVFCVDDRAKELEAILQASYGSPRLVQTNAAGSLFFEYTVDQIGVAINCNVDDDPSRGPGKKYTHLVIVKASALRL